MASAGKCLLWLTALTTMSLAVTGCGGSESRTPSADPVSTTATHHPSRPTHPVMPSHTGDARVSTSTSPVAVTTTPPQPFLLVTSDGSDIVRVAGRAVRFPVSVTDATVSPNGMVVAFVDGLGNIATAHLDGTDVRVLTATDPGVRRAQPTFEDGGSEIIFTERGHDGVWRLKEVAADGRDDLAAGKPDPTVAETESDGGHDTGPSATWFQASHTETARSVVVFEHRTPRGKVTVYITDRNQRGFGATPLLPGRAPAVSPAGDRVAFIGPAGQLEVVSLTDGKRRPTQITWNAHPTGHLTWSPDGRRILFSTPRDVESVGSSPLRPGHNPVRVVLGHPAVASTASLARPAVGTYAGTDPVRVALAVSRARFIDGTELPMAETDGYGVSWADHVTLVSTSDPSAAAPAAAIAAGGPILFVRDGRLDPEVQDEIVRLLQRPHGLRMRGTVDIVGTRTDVPDSVETVLRTLGFHVRRFAPETAAADSADVVRGSYDTYVVVSKDDLPAVASSVGAMNPVLLTIGTAMPPATAAKLDKMAHVASSLPTVYAVGRQAQTALRSSWPGKRPLHVVDVGGDNPIADSLAAVRSLYDAPGRLSVTTDADWHDSLIAGMVGPALVVDQRRGPATDARGWLSASAAALRAIYVLGGPSSLSRTVGRATYGTRYVVHRAPTDITQ
jgi:hypothetical protein